MFKLADRVKQTTSTSGSGTVTLQSTFGGFQSFANGIGNGNSTFYTIENGSNFEVGIGTYNSAGNTLSRDTVLRSSNSDSHINLNGVSIVFCTYPADRSVFLNDSGYITALDTEYVGIRFPDNTFQTTAASSAVKTYRTVTSNTTLTKVYNLTIADCTSGPIVLTLPAATGNGGVELVVKKIGGNLLTIVPTGSDTIDGKSSLEIHYEYQAFSFMSNNTVWYIF